MARADLAHPKNAAGPWFVDTRCIRCDAARNWAPGLIDMDADGRSFVAYQPVGEEQEAVLWRAAAGCPTRSIGNHQQPREPTGVFPYQLTQGVFALGNNALSSFGAHSYLVARPDGNMMIDSPRFSRPLAAHVDKLGGVAHVLLTHRDDVADAARWAERYGARVWIGDADSDAAPYATGRDGRLRSYGNFPGRVVSARAGAYGGSRAVSRRRPVALYGRHAPLEPSQRGV